MGRALRRITQWPARILLLGAQPQAAAAIGSGSVWLTLLIVELIAMAMRSISRRGTLAGATPSSVALELWPQNKVLGCKPGPFGESAMPLKKGSSRKTISSNIKTEKKAASRRSRPSRSPCGRRGNRLRLQARWPGSGEGRHRRIVGRRSGGGEKQPGPHHPDHVPGGRNLRCRVWTLAPVGLHRVSLRRSVQVHWQDRQADIEAPTGADHGSKAQQFQPLPIRVAGTR